MTEDKNKATTAPESAERAEWERPAVQVIVAGGAEGATGGGLDNIVYS